MRGQSVGDVGRQLGRPREDGDVVDGRVREQLPEYLRASRAGSACLGGRGLDQQLPARGSLVQSDAPVRMMFIALRRKVR